MGILIVASIGAQDITPAIKDAASAHYDSLLQSKCVDYSYEIKRCNPVVADDFKIIRVRGDEDVSVPRGTRLCWVDMIVDGKERSIPVSISIEPTEYVPVASVSIQPRTALSDSLIEWRCIETADLGSSQLLGRDEMKGMWAKVRIPKGAVVTKKRLKPIPAIVIGQEIEIVSRIGAVEAKVEGKALEDGRIGEKIRIENALSGQRLRGVIESEKVVVVE